MGKPVPDKEFFVEMVYENIAIIHKICRLYASGEDREDLKQEIIFQLWKSYPSYRGEAKFQSWMYRVALNTAMLGLRAQKIKYMHLSGREADPVEEIEMMPDDDLKISQMYREIAKLNDLEKTIIFLYLEQCSYEQIAEITGISIKNVSVRLVRIRRKLKEKLRIQNSES